ncbi:MAG: DNA-binding protein [Candidatus Thermoplasmatota archaeon]|nr:DNA-binding protein [Candidatus Thermoplasmatota archaeon]MCL5963450.1 DNA-binding protein [Candidatus Thermoplasmatota archaeon]
MSDEEEMQRIRLKKQKEYEESLYNEQMNTEKEEREHYNEEKKKILRQILTPEARERIARIRLVKPDVADNIEQQLISLAMSGKIRNMIDDDTLKKILDKIIPEKKEIKIVRR